MGKESAIQWCDSTGGPFLICTEVSEGCANCYARELMQSRLAHMIRKAYRKAGFKDWETRAVWGKTAPRVLTKGFWKQIEALHRKPFVCDKCGAHYVAETPFSQCMNTAVYPAAPELNSVCGGAFHRARVFPSLIDWLDDMPAGIIDQEGNWLKRWKVIADFLYLVMQTPGVDWLLLTKRPEEWRTLLVTILENIYDQAEEYYQLHCWLTNWLNGKPPVNVWMMVSAENQKAADERVPKLLEIPAVCHGVSYEPALGPVVGFDDFAHQPIGGGEIRRLDWVIGGFESGAGARSGNLMWLVEARRQCKAAGIAFFCKQVGPRPYFHLEKSAAEALYPNGVPAGLQVSGSVTRHYEFEMTDPKGGWMDEWPLEELKVREWPKVERSVAA